MWMGIRKIAGLAMLLGLSALVLTACGSGDDTTTTTARPVVSPATADHLAKLSDRIASDLDAGDTCHAAHAADDLHAAVEDSDLPANSGPASTRSPATWSTRSTVRRLHRRPSPRRNRRSRSPTSRTMATSTVKVTITGTGRTAGTPTTAGTRATAGSCLPARRS